jgi:outer membrane biosynthesis protein TonB
MKLVGVISTAVLSLTLGAAAPAYAQEQHDQQEEQKAKPAQDEKKAQPEEKAKQEEKNAKPEEKNAQAGEKRQAGREKRTAWKDASQAEPAQQCSTAVAAFPTTVTRPISDSEHTFRVSQGDYRIAASNTAAIRSGLLARGQATGSTRKTFMSSRLTACITCATRCIRALTLNSASWNSGPIRCGLGRNQLNFYRRGSSL